ncbi:hypothetical protein A0H81_12624 [Grifola frondosa]|uniref:G domain-containing protein n=1 Tax=Grifola frondosa TaxID=5627 RepID=A0A1C7LRM0_GRIFR|nr:hypothetical protein A0H81_12624 [Grifola frondosa]
MRCVHTPQDVTPFSINLSLYPMSSASNEEKAYSCTSVHIAIMGPTGSGKTSFVNLASITHVSAGAAQLPEQWPKTNDRDATLIYTPGFDGTADGEAYEPASGAAFLATPRDGQLPAPAPRGSPSLSVPGALRTGAHPEDDRADPALGAVLPRTGSGAPVGTALLCDHAESARELEELADTRRRLLAQAHALQVQRALLEEALKPRACGGRCEWDLALSCLAPRHAYAQIRV